MSLDWCSLFPALPPPIFGGASGEWLGHLITDFTHLFPDRSFFNLALNVRALIAIMLVSICCGAVGSLVVGGRMAFFSDALAHCSFAGVSIGFLLFQSLIVPHRPGANFWEWVTPLMAAFGMVVGLGIVAVRQRTGLASDTVIGVFFSAAIGLAAMLRKLINKRAFFSLEDFLFGNPLTATSDDLVVLAGLTVVTLLFLAWGYNHLLLGSFNTSLALSRRVPVRLANFLFVALLAVIVNLCLRSVGALLINGLADRSGRHGHERQPQHAPAVLGHRGDLFPGLRDRAVAELGNGHPHRRRDRDFGNDRLVVRGAVSDLDGRRAHVSAACNRLPKSGRGNRRRVTRRRLPPCKRRDSGRQ